MIKDEEEERIGKREISTVNIDWDRETWRSVTKGSDWKGER